MGVATMVPGRPRVYAVRGSVRVGWPQAEGVRLTEQVPFDGIREVEGRKLEGLLPSMFVPAAELGRYAATSWPAWFCIALRAASSRGSGSLTKMRSESGTVESQAPAEREFHQYSATD